MGENINTENPISKGLNVVVSIPQNIKIKLVDASILNAFELWIFLSGITLNFVTGFFVAWICNTEPKVEKILIWITIFFSIIFIVFLIAALINRSKMKKGAKEVEFPIGNPSES